MCRYALWGFILAAGPCFAFLIGNPAQPDLTLSSVVRDDSENCALRVAYLDDYIYSMHVKNEYNFGPSNEKPPVVQLSTDAALITLNLWKRLDIYGIVGSSQLQMDEEIYTRNEFSWGVGGKILFFSNDNLRFGCDFKYFQSDQKPQFLVVSGMPFNIASDWTIVYEEYEAALGAAYQTTWLCPYINATYITSKIRPRPFSFLVDVPGMSEPSEASIHSFDAIRRWGLAVGATLIGGSKITFAIESRFFNQNAIDANLEVRF